MTWKRIFILIENRYNDNHVDVARMGYENSPHFLLLQLFRWYFINSLSSSHFAPPLAGAGLLHSFSLCLVHLLVPLKIHSPKGPHLPHFPSTTHNENNLRHSRSSIWYYLTQRIKTGLWNEQHFTLIHLDSPSITVSVL